MTTFGRGRADYLELGDWNAVCYECGRKRKASTLLQHWQGYYVCPEHWEPRQPQDFVRSIPDVQTPSWTQNSVNSFVLGDFLITENSIDTEPIYILSELFQPITTES